MLQNVFTTEKQGTAAVKKLRQQKLNNGLPFMINVKELPSNEYYLEYPDGSILLAIHTPGTQDINILRQLSTSEANELRNRFQLHSGSQMPTLYILTGSNGAGKSSVGPAYLPEDINSSVFDGDKLFMQKRTELWMSGIKSHKECKKLAAEMVEETFDRLVAAALHSTSDFAYEGHFTNDATQSIPAKFKEAGYAIHLLFFGLTNTALSETRVVGRAKEGGHYVDPLTIASNFYGNLEKLDVYFPMFDSVTLTDTSEIEHRRLAILTKGHILSVIPIDELPDWFTTYLPNIMAAVARNDK